MKNEEKEMQKVRTKIGEANVTKDECEMHTGIRYLG